MKMRTILLATVAGVLLTGNAIARDKCPMSNSNCQTARGDILDARRGALQDELTALREQIARETNQARAQIKEMKDQVVYQLQLAQEQGERELKKTREQLTQLSNKINTLRVQNRMPVEPVESLQTNQINVPVGEVRVWHTPKSFKTAIIGDTEIADITMGETDADVVINAKKEGFTNFVLVDGEGIVVVDVKLQVGNPLPLHQVVFQVNGKRVSYQCPPEDNHRCYPTKDERERMVPPKMVITTEGSTTVR